MIMDWTNEKKKPLKKVKGSCQPIMTSWGIGEGRPPLTSDPENPIKPFASYEADDKEDD